MLFRTPFGQIYRRLLFGLLAILLTISVQTEAGAQQFTVQDISGRKVVLERPAQRILIDDGRFLTALALIHDDPVSLLAGWPHDVNRLGERTYEAYLTKFPRIGTIPQVSSSAGEFSLELALAVRPDVAIVSLGQGPTSAQVAQLERAGVKVIFIDFFNQPFRNLNSSLQILGAVIDRSAEAKEYLDFRRLHMDRIAQAVQSHRGTRPTVFLEAHAGISADCCNSPGRGNIGDYIEFVGGHNIGADVLPGATGRLNLEYVLSRDPKVYVATGGPHLERTEGLVLGPGYTVQQSRSALTRMSARRGISQLSAVRAGRAHGLSHQLLNSPLDILAIESLAKWIHPELFQDVNPTRTLREINERFLVVPLEGTNWVDLR